MDTFETTLEPYSRTNDLYQSYYRASIAAYCGGHGISYREHSPSLTPALRFLGRVRQTERLNGILPKWLRTTAVDGAARLMGAGVIVEHAVGKYVLRTAGRETKICIDAGDPGQVTRPELLAWSDLYFKTNYWPTLDYPAKVIPLANLNPLVLEKRNELRALRTVEPEWDLFGFFRVWGRVEHNLALFEALAKLKCRKKLIAYLISADYQGEAERMEKAGISWTTQPMPLKELWDLAARSRLNIVRHGVDDCIPWRMTDMLAMGHCPVLDYPARTQWHVPLEENVHYLSLDVPPEGSVSAEEFAGRITERVAGWLDTPELLESVAANAGSYFDENLAPERLGRYLVERAAAGVAAPR